MAYYDGVDVAYKNYVAISNLPTLGNPWRYNKRGQVKPLLHKPILLVNRTCRY